MVQPGIRDSAGRSGWLSPLAIGGAGRCDRGRRDRASGAGEISGKWQAARCAGPNDRSSGSSSAHWSCAKGHRVRNRHSDGGVIALGSSPATPARTVGLLRLRVGDRCRGSPGVRGGPGVPGPQGVRAANTPITKTTAPQKKCATTGRPATALGTDRSVRRGSAQPNAATAVPRRTAAQRAFSSRTSWRGA